MTLHEKIAQIRVDAGKVVKDSKNPHFKNTYASLDAVMHFLQPHLDTHGLTISHRGTGQHVTTTVRDLKSGEYVESSLPLPDNVKPQDIGSAVTYYRRYNTVMLFDLLFDEDQDGHISTQGEFRVKKGTTKPVQQTNAPQTNIEPTTTPLDARMCEKCGSQMVHKTGEKNGKKWAGWFCESKEFSHTVWVNNKS